MMLFCRARPAPGASSAWRRSSHRKPDAEEERGRWPFEPGNTGKCRRQSCGEVVSADSSFLPDRARRPALLNARPARTIQSGRQARRACRRDAAQHGKRRHQHLVGIGLPDNRSPFRDRRAAHGPTRAAQTPLIWRCALSVPSLRRKLISADKITSCSSSTRRSRHACPPWRRSHSPSVRKCSLSNAASGSSSTIKIHRSHACSTLTADLPLAKAALPA